MIGFNNILPSVPRRCQSSRSFRFPHQNCMNFLPYTCHMPCPSSPFSFGYPCHVRSAVHILIMSLPTKQQFYSALSEAQALSVFITKSDHNPASSRHQTFDHLHGHVCSCSNRPTDRPTCSTMHSQAAVTVTVTGSLNCVW
jgi:hypothetical protein